VVALRARHRRIAFAACAREVWRRETDVPLRAVLMTAGAVLLVAGWVAAIWPHYHVLGTDRTGNDVLYQALKSVRTAIVIGSLATLATLPFAIAFGILAGYFKGWADDAIQYLYTVLSSIPGVLLIAGLRADDPGLDRQEPAALRDGAGARRRAAAAAVRDPRRHRLATLCRLLRAETLKLSELDYVQAARAFGVSNLGIMRRHIFPNLMHIVLIVARARFLGAGAVRGGG